MAGFERNSLSSSPLAYVRLFRSSSSNNDAAEIITGSPKKGFVPVLVGTDNESMERFCVPIKLINHPFLVSLLDHSVHEFGHNQQGLLRVLCDADDFKGILKSISGRKQFSVYAL